MSAEGLGAYLATLDEAALTTLVSCRRELQFRPPRSLEDAASRLAQPASVWDALQSLDRTAAQVGAVCAVLGGRVTVDDLTAALRRTGPVPDGHVESALRRLQDRGLAWPVAGGTAWRVPAAMGHHSAALLGVGPPFRWLVEQQPLPVLQQAAIALGVDAVLTSREVADALCDVVEKPQRLADVVQAAPREVRETLERFATAGPQHLVDAVAADWLGERCLLVERPDGLYVPGELVLLARGDRLVPQVRVEPSGAAAAPHAAGADEALRLVQRVRALLRAVDASPLKRLRDGGIGVQEQKRLAKRLGELPDDVRWLLDLCGDADLLTTLVAAGDVTRAGEVFLDIDDVDAYLRLAGAVLDADRVDAMGTAALRHPPLSRGIPTLREAAACPLVEDSIAWLSWRWYGARLEHLATLVGLLERCGLFSARHPRPWSEPLAAGDLDAAAAALRAELPPPQDDVVLQADGTAVVAGRPSPGLRRLLDALAEREGDRTWRVSADRVRAALDGGATAADLLDEIQRRSKHAVPQAVRQLVSDVADRHGRIDVVPSSTLLRVPDRPLAVELLHDKRLSRLGLEEVQPGLLSSVRAPAEVLAALRETGHAPTGPPERQRQRPAGRGLRARSSYGALPVPDVVALLRRPASPPQPPLLELWRDADADPRFEHLAPHEQLLLERALTDGSPVEIDYRDGSGRLTTRVVEDLVDEQHLLVGWCRLRDDERNFLPRGVLAVRAAP